MVARGLEAEVEVSSSWGERSAVVEGEEGVDGAGAGAGGGGEGFWRARAMSSRVGRVVSSLGEGGLDIGTGKGLLVSVWVSGHSESWTYRKLLRRTGRWCCTSRAIR